MRALLYLVQAAGWLMVAFGVFGAASDLEKALHAELNRPVITVVMVSAFVIGGGSLIRFARGRLQPISSLQDREQVVLDAAKRHRGLITPVEVAAATVLTVVESKRELDRLTKLDACRHEVSEDGLDVYRFPELAEETAKERLL